jgi:hypothetical protein
VPEIRILVDGLPALTTAQAAARHGRSRAVMRMLFSRYDLEPVARLDDRTPLYDEAALAELVTAMPGQGKGGGRPRKPADAN